QTAGFLDTAGEKNGIDHACQPVEPHDAGPPQLAGDGDRDLADARDRCKHIRAEQSLADLGPELLAELAEGPARPGPGRQPRQHHGALPVDRHAEALIDLAAQVNQELVADSEHIAVRNRPHLAADHRLLDAEHQIADLVERPAGPATVVFLERGAWRQQLRYRL